MPPGHQIGGTAPLYGQRFTPSLARRIDPLAGVFPHDTRGTVVEQLVWCADCEETVAAPSCRIVALVDDVKGQPVDGQGHRWHRSGVYRRGRATGPVIPTGGRDATGPSTATSCRRPASSVSASRSSVRASHAPR